MPLPSRPRAVITGAASGLGRALALDLAARHARILVADVDTEGAEETVRLVVRAGGEASATRCDVSRSGDVAALVGEADHVLGGVDLLVNNAGVAVSGPMGDVPLADWDWVMGVNLWGVIYGCHAFVPRFREQRAGHILNVASAAGLLSAPQLAPYNVTKAGVVALSETLSAELREHGVTVTVLCPTFFKTRIVERSRVHGPFGRDVTEKLMSRAKIQADGVARIAIEAVDAGQLYAVPHADGLWFWRLKRAVPEAFHYTLLSQLQRFVR
jgi:NAD(P)-dependent dehydrogenase (short-subunit alcohol dehydrogenase family)